MKLLGDCLCIGMRFSDNEEPQLEVLPWCRPEIKSIATRMADAYNKRSQFQAIRRKSLNQKNQNQNQKNQNQKITTSTNTDTNQEESTTHLPGVIETENEDEGAGVLDKDSEQLTSTSLMDGAGNVSTSTSTSSTPIQMTNPGKIQKNNTSSLSISPGSLPIELKMEAKDVQAVASLQTTTTPRHGRERTLTTTVDMLRGIAHTKNADRRSDLLDDFHTAVRFQNSKIENVVNYVTILDCNYRQNYFYSFILLLLSSLQSHLQI